MSNITTKDLFLQRELDMLLLILFIGLLPIDTINGVLLHKGIVLPISIAQFYKAVLLVFLILKTAFRPKFLLYSFLIFCILISPSIYQIIKLGSIHHLFPDLIKTSKYLNIIFSFYFFVNYFQNNRGEKILTQFIFISYTVVVLNILLKYVGIGYPMYTHNNIGSRGFFFAGNEISTLLLILSAIIGKHLWVKKKYSPYIIIGLLSVFTALTISSKTSMLGVVFVLLIIPIKRPNINKLNFKALLRYSPLLLLIPIVGLILWKIIQNSKIYSRFTFFYDKLDLPTFILSNRNTFFFEYLDIYQQKHNFLEKTIGVGQTVYEDLSGMQMVEIDVIDILFAQGIIGLLVFLGLLIFVLLQSYRFSFFSKYMYANFSFLMCILLFVISCFSGHVFNSGMAGPFIGLTFALMFIKADTQRGLIL